MITDCNVWPWDWSWKRLSHRVLLRQLTRFKNESCSRYQYFSTVQLLSCVWLFATPWTAARQASLSITNSQRLLKLMSIELVMPSNHLILSSVVPFSSYLQSFPVSGSFPVSQFLAPGGQSTEVSASALVLPMTIQDWFPLGLTPCSPGTLKSLLQQHSSTVSILQCSAFFIVQLSHPYMTTGKTIALTWWTFVGKVMSLLFNMLSLTGWSNFPSKEQAAVRICSDSGAPQNKVSHYVHCFPIYLPWSDETRFQDLIFLNVEF